MWGACTRALGKQRRQPASPSLVDGWQGVDSDVKWSAWVAIFCEMVPPTIRALDAAIERGRFERAYLLFGEDEFLKEEKVRAVIARATDPGTREFNLDTHWGAETDAASLHLALEALPMMASQRVLVLRDVTALKKDAIAVLDRYLDHPAPDIVLVLTALAGAKLEDRFAGRTIAVEFKPLYAADLIEWAQRRVEEHGANATPTALSVVCESTGNDLPRLAGEIEKLLSYSSGRPIDEAAVRAIVGVRFGETVRDLLQYAATRDSLRAIELLRPVLAHPKTSGVSIVMALATQLLAISWAMAARRSGVPQSRLERELFGLLKQNPSSVVGRGWSEGVACWIAAMKRWTTEDVEYALHQLAAADFALKDTRLSSDEQVLTSLLLSLASQARRSDAA